MASNAPLKWYDENADNPPWVKALANVRHMAAREGWCYHHVQAIIVAIDQYAEAALGNRSSTGLTGWVGQGRTTSPSARGPNKADRFAA